MRKVLSSLALLIAASLFAADQQIDLKLKTGELKAVNPQGTGVQIDFPFKGYSDAMYDAEQFEALVAAVKKLNVGTLRFPGGCATYAYSASGGQASMKEMTKVYYACAEDKGRWSSFRDFFRFCKATGCRAVYELNMGFYFDVEQGKVFAFAPQDTGFSKRELHGAQLQLPKGGIEYNYDMLPKALAEARLIAETAKEMQVEVIWEFGNEDFIYFSPETYAANAVKFARVIQSVLPEAQFLICTEGYSWSDWRWTHQVADLISREKIPLFSANFHVYVHGGGKGTWTNGASVYHAIIDSWAQIRHLHTGVAKSFAEHGYPNLACAVTEGNVHVGQPMVGKPYEHGLGRALGEAAIYPERIAKCKLLIHHDLIRSTAAETWFCRLFYDPDKPVAERYTVPCAATVMGIVAEHARRDIIYDDGRGTCASQWKDGVFVTVGNPSDSPRNVTIALPRNIRFKEEAAAELLFAKDLDTPEFQTSGIAVKGYDNVWTFVLPPYSFSAVKIDY